MSTLMFRSHGDASPSLVIYNPKSPLPLPAETPRHANGVRLRIGKGQRRLRCPRKTKLTKTRSALAGTPTTTNNLKIRQAVSNNNIIIDMQEPGRGFIWRTRNNKTFPPPKQQTAHPITSPVQNYQHHSFVFNIRLRCCTLVTLPTEPLWTGPPHARNAMQQNSLQAGRLFG